MSFRPNYMVCIKAVKPIIGGSQGFPPLDWSRFAVEERGVEVLWTDRRPHQNRGNGFRPVIWRESKIDGYKAPASLTTSGATNFAMGEAGPKLQQQ
ncbi:hypothetical protein PanWU01x14_253310 [Parasponia andersonii]|uniref:Uncharacterized protein n=1 Tax=Parasponia andersonii TaxID=3476 RepID=A0A2P5BBP3_PARAD|nr:hypothetical protein PanWU01x14_253310 [Parasponia andersonii]